MVDFAAFEEYLSQGFDENSVYLSIPRRQRSSHPLAGILNSKQSSHYLIYNLASAAQGPVAMLAGARALERHMQETATPEKHETSVLMPGIMPDDARSIRAMLQEAATRPMLQSAGGGVAAPLKGTYLVDPRTVRNLGRTAMPDATPRDLANFQKMVEYHEAAHLMLDLKEAGADFMSAALMLRQYPDSRSALRQWADFRLIKGISDGGLAADVYGSECHDAIERALSMPRNQLMSMSLRQLHAIGASYDQLNMNNFLSKHTPEKTVREGLRGLDIQRGLKFVWDNVTGFNIPKMDAVVESFHEKEVSLDNMREGLEHTQYPRGTAERRLADNLGEALSRFPLREMPKFGN